MQHPTCHSIRIRSTADAHKIFGAIQQGILQMVTRRLDADERLALRSGCVYAWEERGPHSELTGLGIERFTEGRRWSPSRVRDEFLFYYEKYSPPPDSNPLGNSAEQHPPRDWDPLVKQTYSVWVQTENGRRKWHLTAYFTQATIDELGTIDDDHRIRGIVVPEGIFKSTRIGKGRAKTDDNGRIDAARAATTVPRTYAPFPTPYQYQPQNGSPSMTPVLMHEPYQNRNQSQQSQSPVSPHDRTMSPLNDEYISAEPSMSGHTYDSIQYTAPSPPIHSQTAHYSDMSMQSRRMIENDEYYSSEAATSNWAIDDGYYRKPDQPEHMGDLGYGAYHLLSPSQNGLQSNHNTPSPHDYDTTSLTSSQLPSHGQVYPSPVYILPSGLVPKPQEVTDPRGFTLSPLAHQSDLETMQPSMAPLSSYQPGNLQSGSMEPVNSLIPLRLARPVQTRWVRYPEDEKKLRSLAREERSVRYSP